MRSLASVRPPHEPATGCQILVKAEHMNPGGSVKDRAALKLLRQAEARGQLKPHTGQCIVEGTGGNTGIALAMLGTSLGYKTIFAMPEKTSRDKSNLMELFGAETHRQPAVPFNDEQHYYQVIRRLAQQEGNFGPDQFENTDNAAAHREGTGPEIWRQTRGRIDGFTCASGTGGTMAGVSSYLKGRNSKIAVWLTDPMGSGLAAYVNHHDTSFPASGSTVAEGVGITRLTNNFKEARVDGAFKGTDEEAITMMYYLARHEGLYVGPSAALNVVGAIKLARKLGPNKCVVTVLCDTGDRYRATVYNEAWLKEHNLAPKQVSRGDMSFVL
ncbi:uncharacterized protein MONBRDRAFT_30290 [Monosiga brevicollis MX1]|uniref:Tryptophan synthase beta chain-like PALP domain-containing protein n=1 Tax=Monosiga brevicollis TaxID=81824 RepID=A9VDJ3_MONBE|nr:uncharacterized protein MONBRDRAFT_30290 [Monosiga brevicollis MX1]EDQ84402.1 predicted protein [Monosiga brevicollis MX1]|eukprot:XP_001750803.1 hypothetical protein [Monosiga brevicollis MX1]